MQSQNHIYIYVCGVCVCACSRLRYIKETLGLCSPPPLNYLSVCDVRLIIGHTSDETELFLLVHWCLCCVPQSRPWPSYRTNTGQAGLLRLWQWTLLLFFYSTHPAIIVIIIYCNWCVNLWKKQTLRIGEKSDHWQKTHQQLEFVLFSLSLSSILPALYSHVF